MVLVHTWQATIQEEQNLHRSLTPFKVGGEWFEFNVGTLLEAISLTQKSILKPLETPQKQFDPIIGEYGQVIITNGSCKGMNAFYSDDIEVSLYEIDKDMIPHLNESLKANDTTYVLAKVYVEGIEQDMTLPHTWLSLATLS